MTVRVVGEVLNLLSVAILVLRTTPDFNPAANSGCLCPLEFAGAKIQISKGSEPCTTDNNLWLSDVYLWQLLASGSRAGTK